jgi:hypothetical protein
MLVLLMRVITMYVVEMRSGLMTYVASFIKIGSGIQKFVRWGIRTHRQQGASFGFSK